MSDIKVMVGSYDPPPNHPSMIVRCYQCGEHIYLTFKAYSTVNPEHAMCEACAVYMALTDPNFTLATPNGHDGYTIETQQAWERYKRLKHIKEMMHDGG